MDAKSTAVNSLKSACKIFLADLQALPDGAFTRKFGEKTRTIADIVYEVNLVNDHICMVIRGEEPFAWPEGDWIYAPAGFDTKEIVIAAFEKSSEGIVATAEALTAEEIEGSIMTEHGERTRFQQCQFMALHLWYHSGQLNFIQTMLGDDGWHWA